MRTLSIVLVAILSLLLLAVLLGPRLVDWNAFKPRLSAAVEEATGRHLEIEGDLGLSILPTPTLSAEGASLSNIEGGSAPTMVSLKTLEVQVALMPLIGGDLQVESIVLGQPTILLERLADGRANWELSAPEPPARPADATNTEQAGEVTPAPREAGPVSDEAGTARRPLSVALEHVTITDGTVIYRDAGAGLEERIEALNATLSAVSLRGPFQLEGDARVRGTAATFSASTGRLALAGETPVSILLNLPDAGSAEARFNGRITAGTAAAAAGELSVVGKDLLALIDTAAPGVALPGNLAAPYNFSGRLSFDGERIRLSAIDLSMADSAVSGETSVRLGNPTDLQVAVTVSRLDLDAMLADGGGGGQDPAPAASFALPSGLRASVDLQVDTLVYRGEVVRQMLINADLQEGRVVLNQALALLPGGGNVVLSGTLTPAAGQPRFVGQVEATADNLRAVMSWLGVDPGAVPSDRLRRASLLADLDATPQQASITAIDLEVDASRVTGGVALALRERLGVGLGLTVDRINLDAYLPTAGLAEQDEPADSLETAGRDPVGQAAEEPSKPTETGKAERAEGQEPAGRAPPSARSEAAEGPAALLGAVDANIDLTVGQVTYNGQSARQVTFDGTLQQGRLTLRRLTVGDLAGGAFSLSGLFTGLPDAPAVEDGSFDISVTDTGRLSRLLGDPVGGALAQLGAVRASGSASGSAEGFTYNVDVSALGGSIFSSGRVNGLRDQLKISDARLQASDLEGAALARVAGLPGDSPLARLENLEVTSRFDYSSAEATYDTRVKTLGAEFVAEGTAHDFASGLPQVDFRFAAIHEDLATFLRRVLGDTPLRPGAGKLDLRAQVSGSPLKLQIAEIVGDVGPTIESGTVEIDLTRAKPFVKADLSTREIDLVRLFGDGGGGGQDPAPRWSRQPLELGTLRDVESEFAIQAQALRQGKLVLAPLSLRAGLAHGVLSIDQFEGRLYEGKLTSRGQLDVSGDLPVANLSLELAGLDAGAFLRAQGTGRVAGRMDLTAELSARGNSEAALVTSLDGQGTVGGELTVEARAQEQVGNVVLGILGEQVRELEGVTNPLNELFAAFAGRPGTLSGSVQVDDGVATTEDLQLVGEGARLRARGTLANLPAWTMALSTALYREGSDDPQVQVDLGGRLDEPNVRLKGAALSISPNDGGAQPADVIRGLIRGLGKGD